MAKDNKYDNFGLRNEKSVSDGTATEVSRHALDGWNPAKLPSHPGRGAGGEGPVGTEGFNVWTKLDGSSSLETRYLHNDDVDHLLARIDHIDTAAVQLWYLQDYQNSTRYVLDQAGTIVDSLRYDGYGNIDTGSELFPSMRGDYAWTGREINVETELQYNRARWYDGRTGKWISQDPLGFDAGDSNLYRYVNNRPTNAVDPSGLQIPIRPPVIPGGGLKPGGLPGIRPGPFPGAKKPPGPGLFPPFQLPGAPRGIPVQPGVPVMPAGPDRMPLPIQGGAPPAGWLLLSTSSFANSPKRERGSA